tara:strand:- start:11 stop:286 length:276 start_codon:yes stop_codon:yes gene_type:complete
MGEDELLYQGIIIFERSLTNFEDYPWVMYVVQSQGGEEDFNSYVKRGHVDDSGAGGLEESIILDSRWLEDSTNWDSIRDLGNEMKEEVKKK